MNCVLQQNATITPGAFKLDGEFSGRAVAGSGRFVPAAIASRRTSGRLLSQAAAAPRALPSPDGLWRGTYACGPSATTSGWPVHAPAANAVRRWVGLGKFQAGRLEWQHSEARSFRRSPAGVTITRSQIRTPVSEVTLSGTYDWSAIRASGIETGSARRTCTLALTRNSDLRWLASLRPRPLLLPLHSLPYRRSRLPNREPLSMVPMPEEFLGRARQERCVFKSPAVEDQERLTWQGVAHPSFISQFRPLAR